MKVYLLETGVLLDKSDKDYGSCSQISDKQHGFYDECQEFKPNLDKAEEETKTYVQSGVPGTYAVVSGLDTGYGYEEDGLEEMDLSGIEYSLADVVFSFVKQKDGKLVNDFLGSTQE